MAPAQKKVVLRSFSNELAWGYLPQSGFLRDGQITLMQPDGRLTPIPIKTLKRIAYVRDFNLDDKLDPERIGRMTFPARPRGDGVWLRLIFRDNELLEGLTTLDLAFADTLLDDRGLFLTPPDLHSNTLRLFVPRPALQSIEVLGFVTAPSRRLAAHPAAPSGTKRKSQVTPDTQPSLFDE
ncbi:MAG TPA: hypothetical protein VK814_15790 [Acidobacteriaceae bacterium]|jgi:hypothetical protein|nr:hypothetical protein [Acidobacteriaceae bacterium]